MATGGYAILLFHNTRDGSLVRAFVRDHDLDLDVIELHDHRDPQTLDREVLENGCRNNLEHCRWGAHLERLVRELGGKVVIWKGQLADLTMTPKWRSVSRTPSLRDLMGRRAIDKLVNRLPTRLRAKVHRRHIEPLFRRVLWERGAMWQGAHVSLLRQIANCLVLSAYHGPAMTDVYRRVSFTHAVKRDLRDDIGARFYGRRVCYPPRNPSPPPSKLGREISSARVFRDIAQRAGIAVEEL